MEERIFHWIAQYGYPAVCGLLVLGIVGLPVPDETLLTFLGYMCYAGKMTLVPSFLSAFVGTTCGITISYVLGRTFGLALIHRYGRYLHITEEMVAKAHQWFERAGRWGLTFGYFIPGVRHFTAYAAGMSDLKPPLFALFAYSGGFVWCLTFMTLGYLLGERWEAASAKVHRYVLLAVAATAVIAAAAWAARKWRSRVQ